MLFNISYDRQVITIINVSNFLYPFVLLIIQQRLTDNTATLFNYYYVNYLVM